MWRLNKKLLVILKLGRRPRNSFLVSAKLSDTVTVVSRKYSNVPLLSQMSGFGKKTAVVDQNGSFSYEEILRHSTVLGKEIDTMLRKTGGNTSLVLNGTSCGPRIAFLCPNNVSFAVMVCAIWQVGGIAVPLCKTHPIGEQHYVAADSQVSMILSTQEYSPVSNELANMLKVKHLLVRSYSSPTSDIPGRLSPSDVAMETKSTDVLTDVEDFGAMILYTSGTTGRPKGVLLTHGAISSQILTLVEAWEWSSDDRILHVLPLHHTHGIVNVSLCSLWSGATCYMLPKFDAKEVWKYLLSDFPKLNVFMAVPTIYSKLLQTYNQQNYSEKEKQKIKEKCQEFRLMVSGSAALPESMLNEWETVTGIRFLERYGMTEIGMALSNPLHGWRLPGRVGSPLPNVKVQIVATQDGLDSVVAEGDQHGTIFREAFSEESCGELYVKGPSLFKMYWNKPEATKEAFTEYGWFKTGDTVVCEENSYKILGRTSVDIIKSGGYKISALNIEDNLLTHPNVIECAVVGVPDLEWGQRVAAIVVCAKGKELSLSDLKLWAKGRMVPYHIPSILKCVDSIPRNAMGKVNKKQLVRNYFEVKER